MKRRKFLGNLGLGVGASMLPLTLLGKSNDRFAGDELVAGEGVYLDNKLLEDNSLVLINDECNKYFSMKPDETGRIKLIDLYIEVKDQWKEGGWAPYPFPLVAVTPEMFHTQNGWRIVNIESLYGGSIEDTTTGDFYQGLVVLGDQEFFQNKWEIDGEIINDSCIVRDIENKSVYLLDKHNNKYTLESLKSSVGFTRNEGDRVYSNCYFPPAFKY